MAHFRNDSGVPLSIDRFGLYVPIDGVFDVYDDDADSFRHQASFTELDTAGEPIAAPAPEPAHSALNAPGRLELEQDLPAPLTETEDDAAGVTLPPVEPTPTASAASAPAPAAPAVAALSADPAEAPTTPTATTVDAPVAE